MRLAHLSRQTSDVAMLGLCRRVKDMNPVQHSSTNSYKILRKIGEGGMGEVFEAWDEAHQRKVAVKFLNDTANLERFENEALALARVRHQHVVELFHYGLLDGRYYMAMEHVDGLSVGEYGQRYPVDLATLLDFFIQMTSALAAVHEQGITHCDIKPSNIILDRSLRCKLIDFGIATLGSGARGPEVMGTVNYLAPEIVGGAMATSLSDIYSLGLVFYHLLTGEIPFHGASNEETVDKIRTSPLVFDPRFNSLIPENLRRVIFRMTSKAARMRHKSCDELLTELKTIKVADLPVDLHAKVQAHIVILNRSEVQTYCQRLAFLERRLVENIAISGAPVGAELMVPEQTIHEAISRFERAKNAWQEQGRQKLQTKPPAQNLPKIMWTVLGVLAFWFGVTVTQGPSFNQSNLASHSLPKRPKYKEGDSYRIRASLFEAEGLSRQYTEHWTIRNLGRGEVQWSNGNDGELTLSRDFYLPALKIRQVAETSDLDSELSAAGPSLFKVPLGTVVQNRVSMTLTASKRHWDFSWQCSMQAGQTVSTKFGNLEAYKIVCTSEDGPIQSDAYVYAPAIHYWLTRDFLLRDGLTHAHYELLSYELAH